jgi:hypothetical protein
MECVSVALHYTMLRSLFCAFRRNPGSRDTFEAEAVGFREIYDFRLKYVLMCELQRNTKKINT